MSTCNCAARLSGRVDGDAHFEGCPHFVPPNDALRRALGDIISQTVVAERMGYTDPQDWQEKFQRVRQIARDALGVMGTSAPSISDEQIDTILREFGDEDVMRDLSAEEKRQRVRAAIAGVKTPLEPSEAQAHITALLVAHRDMIDAQAKADKAAEVEAAGRMQQHREALTANGVGVPRHETFSTDESKPK